MKPYTIHCTTCQARLRVRKTEAIGQILACPKCGSMVLITPPPDGSGSGSGSGSAAEIQPPEASAPAPPPPRKPRFREDFPDPDDTSPALPDAPTAAPPTPLAAEDVVAPPLPTAPGPARLQQWAVLAAAAIGGVALAVVVLTLVAGRGCKRTAPARTTAQRTAKSPPESAATNTNPPATAAVTKDHDRARSSDNPDQRKQPNDVPDSTGTTDDASSPDAERTPAAPSTADTAETPDATSNDQGGPPDMVASDDSPALGQLPAEKIKTPSSDTTPQPAEDTTPVTPSNLDDPAEHPGADDTADVNARLNVMLLHQELADMPLARFAAFIADLTGLPVTTDVDALLPTGLTPSTAVSVSVQAVTVQQMVAAALAPLELVLTVNGAQLLITSDLAEQVNTKDYSVSDLTENTSQAAAFAERLQTCFAPESWHSSGGVGEVQVDQQTLRISQTNAVHFRIRRFFDRLRLARGQRPLGNLPAIWTDLKPISAHAATALSRPITVRITKPTRVADVLHQVETETDLRILVDWRQVTGAGMTPLTPTTLQVEDQPLRDVLNQWLGPAQLGFRVVTPNTLQIATQASIAARLEVEIYQLPTPPTDAAATAQLLDKARKHVGAQYFRDDGGNGVMYYDEASKCLIAALPQPRQHALQQWLSELAD